MPYDEIAWSLGLVCRRLTLPNMGMLGTCFSLSSARHFVTAAHCVKSVPMADLEVQTLGLGSTRSPVVKVTTHATADLSILTIDLPDEHFVTPLKLGTLDAFYGGAPVASFGFPSDTTHMGTAENFVTRTGPTLRFFRGHVQRTGLHVSQDGYTFSAMELSFAAPAGLSGGPVFMSERNEPVALIAENQESSTYLRTITDVREGGIEFHETIHSVINYAIAVDLTTHRAWLEAGTRDA